MCMCVCVCVDLVLPAQECVRVGVVKTLAPIAATEMPPPLRADLTALCPLLLTYVLYCVSVLLSALEMRFCVFAHLCVCTICGV
ncbi:MAG: hypothetical protein P4L40_04905 [Terracidiphilus sp.]|nr:hypothetical protein [Terracidiphilus sp.]